MANAARRQDGTFGDLVRTLRGTFSGGKKPVSQQRLSELLGVSWSTVARWEAGQNPDQQTQARLERLAAALEALDDMVRPEDRIEFFDRRHPLLLHMRPIDLLNTAEGFEAVMSLLERGASGAIG